MAPPPPPPAPPPAPSGFPKGPKAKPSGGGAQDRSALLSSIQGGARLKKAVTNDRSSPVVGNNKRGDAPPSGMGGGNTNSSPSSGGPMGMGGLFAGGIPKLPNKGGYSGPPKRTGGPSTPIKLPSHQPNGRMVNGGISAPPPPSQSSKPARPISSNVIRKTETVENQRNLEHNNANNHSMPSRNIARAQPPPPPNRPAPSHNVSNRPSSMVGRPLPPTPPTSEGVAGPPRGAPPPPPRGPSGPPGRPNAPPPPVRTTSAQGGGTIGRSGGSVRPQLHLAPRQEPPPPPPPHSAQSIRPSYKPASLPNKNIPAVGSNNFNSDRFEQRFKFHSVNEFSPPEKNNNIVKTYPSQSANKASNQQRRAPPPPPPPPR